MFLFVLFHKDIFLSVVSLRFSLQRLVDGGKEMERQSRKALSKGKKGINQDHRNQN